MLNLAQLTLQEFERQKNSLCLIASENLPSPKVLHLLGSVWSNKYAEGYPGRRYYAGNQYTDILEQGVSEMALKVFDPTGEYGVNLQVLSGSPANSTVYLAMLNPGDTIMSLNLASGGHLSHLHSTSNWLKFFQHVSYEVKSDRPDVFELDIQDFAAKLERFRPKLTIIGFSAYPRQYQFAELCRLAHAAGSLVLADIAHINGLVAANLHDSPFKPGVDGADFVSMTTHKTLRGPRGAMLFAKQEHMDIINKTVFPGTSGGPHMQKIAAIGQCLAEILGDDTYPDDRSFLDYMQNVLKTTSALESGLKQAGLEVVSPTQTHLCLVRLPQESDSLQVQNSLAGSGIITNRNQLPLDSKTPWRPSGMRFGTAALASRGLTGQQAQELGIRIGDFILGKISPDDLSQYRQDLLGQLSWWYQL